MLSSPIFLLGSAFATLWASLFHLLLGRGWTDLVRFWFIALVGFAIGQLMAQVIGLPWPTLGQVRVIEATVVCWVAMFVAHWVKV
ncbi:MAG: hypothetical protein JXA74_13500 [Anaerolineae bacterium]|nr:hypothetical protein [Anaerolineae bacterium]